MIKNKLLGGVLALLLLCTCVGVCGASIAVQNDSIVGIWVGTGGIESTAGYNVTLVCNQDNTAQLTGSINVAGTTYPVNLVSMTWARVSDTQYRGQSGNQSLDFYLNNDVITTTVNPKTFGYNYNQDFTITLTHPDTLFFCENLYYIFRII